MKLTSSRLHYNFSHAFLPTYLSTFTKTCIPPQHTFCPWRASSSIFVCQGWQQLTTQRFTRWYSYFQVLAILHPKQPASALFLLQNPSSQPHSLVVEWGMSHKWKLKVGWPMKGGKRLFNLCWALLGSQKVGRVEWVVTECSRWDDQYNGENRSFNLRWISEAWMNIFGYLRLAEGYRREGSRWNVVWWMVPEC